MAKTTSTTTTTTKTAKATNATPGSAPARPTAQALTIGATQAQVTTDPDGTKTLRLVRTIKAPAERIYQCFLDADAYAKWIPPHGFIGHVDRMEPKVGGKFHMSFATISRSWSHSFGGKYLELVPNKRIVHTDKFDDPAMGEGEMTVTIDLKPVKDGTEVTIVQSGIPKGPAGEGAPYGWSQSLDNLATLCEQELPF